MCKMADFESEALRYAQAARAAFRQIRASSSHKRNSALLILADTLLEPSVQEIVTSANQKDLAQARENGLKDSLIDRLRLDAKRIADMVQALREIAQFPDPVGEVVRGRTLKSGVRMQQKRVPLGVVFTVFESRPNVTVDIGALCVKSGNAAILRGGKEAIHSNIALHGLFQKALASAGLPADAVQIVQDTDRGLMLEMLKLEHLIDLVVPRGGEQLIQFTVQNSRIPVVKHDRGVCNLFVDQSADPDIALSVAVNAKLQRPSVCNSIENLLIHKDYPHKGSLVAGLIEKGATLLGDDLARALDSRVKPLENPETEYSMEYLDARLSVKVVSSLDEVIDFIYRYGSAHSEAIISRDAPTIEEFIARVDSAAVFVNASTRFHDGGQMGMGAEVGISTGRLHVRGPMGVEHLTTTTYIMTGEGQVRE
jgi:glutamate-5-semialdehyde dehydrogenase